MNGLGHKSKFSVLKVEGDSSSEEDEFTEIMRGAPRIPATQAEKKKAKKRNKKNSGKPTEASEAEWTKMNMEIDRIQYEKDVKKAVLASQETFHEELSIRGALKENEGVESAKTSKKKGSKSQEIKKIASKGDATSFAEEEAARILRTEQARDQIKLKSQVAASGSQVEGSMLEMYKENLSKLALDLEQEKVERKNWEMEAIKYKDRYRQLCEILRDVEVKEKAQLIVEIDKGKKVREELSEQVALLSGELEQAKSKIHQLENHSV